MTVLHGPLVYITDGAQRSLEHFPQVAAFAEAIGSQAIVARLQPQVDPAAAPDPHFTRALGAIVGADQPPVVVPVARRKLGAALLQHAEVRSGAVVLPAQRRFLFNSLHERLIRETRLPLLTLPRDGKIGTVRTILFPADLAPHSLAAFDQTLALCQQLAARLNILHVYGEDRLPPSAEERERRLAAKSPRELLNIHREGIIALVERARAAGVSVNEHMAEGRAHSQILAFSSKNPTDLIAMATHGPRTVEDVLNGTTTSRVVQRAPVPVLVFRAETPA